MNQEQKQVLFKSEPKRQFMLFDAVSNVLSFFIIFLRFCVCFCFFFSPYLSLCVYYLSVSSFMLFDAVSNVLSFFLILLCFSFCFFFLPICLYVSLFSLSSYMFFVLSQSIMFLCTYFYFLIVVHSSYFPYFYLSLFLFDSLSFFNKFVSSSSKSLCYTLYISLSLSLCIFLSSYLILFKR